MNSYERIYSMLIEGQIDWSQEDETESSEGIPAKKRFTAPYTRPKSTKHRRIKPTSSKQTLEALRRIQYKNEQEKRKRAK